MQLNHFSIARNGFLTSFWALTPYEYAASKEADLLRFKTLIYCSF